MTTRTIELGGASFEVPPLPLVVNRSVYPLCRKLVNGGFITRWFSDEAGGEITEADMDDLLGGLFRACQTAQPDLTQETFDALAATPAELFDAFQVLRYQTGGWKPRDPTEDALGEERGAEATPPKSTSPESSAA